MNAPATATPIVDAAAEASSKSWRELAKAMHAEKTETVGRSTGTRYGGQFAEAGFVTMGAYNAQLGYVVDEAVRKFTAARRA